MLYFITVLWTVIVGGCGALLALIEGSKIVALICLIAGFGPFMLVRRNRGMMAKADAAQEAMLASVGVSPGAGFDHSEDGSGVALNRHSKILALRIGEKWKSYPFTDVRGWEANKERAGEIVATGVSASFVAMTANIRASKDAAAASGLFVTVRDIDNPKWRVAMADSNKQARWMEILRQSINEG